MRIISGEYRGRRITAPNNLPVRPTTDRAKEALFNILGHRLDFEDTKALDFFAGIGSITLELISRGCPDVTAVDKHRDCVNFIQKTASELGMEGLRAIRSDVFVFAERTPERYDFIFADPPYNLMRSGELAERILERGLLEADGLLVIEHSDEEDLSGVKGFTEHRRYGHVNFSIFEI